MRLLDLLIGLVSAGYPLDLQWIARSPSVTLHQQWPYAIWTAYERHMNAVPHTVCTKTVRTSLRTDHRCHLALVCHHRSILFDLIEWFLLFKNHLELSFPHSAESIKRRYSKASNGDLQNVKSQMESQQRFPKRTVFLPTTVARILWLTICDSHSCPHSLDLKPCNSNTQKSLVASTGSLILISQRDLERSKMSGLFVIRLVNSF